MTTNASIDSSFARWARAQISAASIRSAAVANAPGSILARRSCNGATSRATRSARNPIRLPAPRQARSPAPARASNPGAAVVGRGQPTLKHRLQLLEASIAQRLRIAHETGGMDPALRPDRIHRQDGHIIRVLRQENRDLLIRLGHVVMALVDQPDQLFARLRRTVGHRGFRQRGIRTLQGCRAWRTELCQFTSNVRNGARPDAVVSPSLRKLWPTQAACA
jgi:hypothetical protein